jgi:hypothetical protein
MIGDILFSGHRMETFRLAVKHHGINGRTWLRLDLRESASDISDDAPSHNW